MGPAVRAPAGTSTPRAAGTEPPAGVDRELAPDAGTAGGAQPVVRQPLRSLRPLFDPAVVAIVGASDDPAKWGNWLARGALAGRGRREVHLVNRRASKVLGERTVPSLQALADPVDLAVIAVPVTGFTAAVEDALANGARAIVGITAGGAETGPEAAAREAALAKRVRDAGAVLLGPNCLGLLDTEAELSLTSNALPSGPIGLLSQSGNLALELGVLAEELGLGFARFVSLGNQADLTAADLLASMADARRVEVVACYCEDFVDGRAFLEAAGDLGRTGRAVVLLTVGRDPASARAARSHTAALVSGPRAVEAAARAAGIALVHTPAELVETAAALLHPRRARGRRVAVVADGGGHGGIAADVCAASGLEVPPFSRPLQDRIGAALGTAGGRSNPVDLAGAGEQDVRSFERVVEAVLESDEVDAVLVTGYFGGYGAYSAELGRAERAVARRLGPLAAAARTPLVVHSMHGVNEVLGELVAARVPVLRRIESAASGLRRLCIAREGAGLPPQVPAAPPVVGEGYFAARALAEAAGVPVVDALAATTMDDALAAGRLLGYPVAVKAAFLEHKSDAGGVVLGIQDEHSLRRAASALWERLGPGVLSVERLVDLGETVELLVGCHRDPRFGAVVVVGIGGIFAELLDDVAAGLAPVDHEGARILLRSLKGAGLLSGARGRPPLALDAAASAIAALSWLAAAHPELSAFEVNPLVVARDQVVALDARMVTTGAAIGDGPPADEPPRTRAGSRPESTADTRVGDPHRRAARHDDRADAPTTEEETA